ncbi:DUF4169 family protein [Beijerinckia mobilis]|uniref:DUF4169 family protein n=1 Tax=Beijerinckia mobilis TaxID=231434 RepID=UPI00054F8A03|nr:DUF4169 family protein [Beijerinckia mobilis]
MGDLVNLRRVRKDKARQTREVEAAANRLLHGRTRAEREKTANERQRAEAHLDAHHLLKEPEKNAGDSVD